MNQDQRELLELAAYAIGEKIGCLGCGTRGCVGECHWNPLTNKADAFDLMVKLHLSVFVGESFICVTHTNMPFSELEIIEEDFTDIEAATMLAITRAAAAIGKQMKEQMK